MGEVTITVDGDVGCGKSLILAKIASMLREEFGANNVNDLCLQHENIDINNYPDFVLESVKNTNFLLKERVTHSIGTLSASHTKGNICGTP